MAIAAKRALDHHGLSRVALYAQHLREGRADGKAKPKVIRKIGATCLIDAGGGLAFPAAALAVNEAVKRAKKYGVAFVGVTNSHHFGAAAYHLAAIADAGMTGIALTNSPAAINAWGGSKAFFGTNPVAAIFPRRNAQPIVVDLSLTEVTRGKIMLYAKENKPIPLGWAVDRDGNVFFTDQPNDRIVRWDAATGAFTDWLKPAGVRGIPHAFVVKDGKVLDFQGTYDEFNARYGH